MYSTRQDSRYGKRPVFERFAAAIRQSSLVDWVTMTVMGLFLIAGAILLVPLILAPADHGTNSLTPVEEHRAEAKSYEYQQCPSSDDAHRPPRQEGTEAEKAADEAIQQALSECLLRLGAVENRTANSVAAQYNVIAAGSAFWAKAGGLIVGYLGLVSGIGVVVAVGAASDARRSIDANVETVGVSRRASRAYVQIEGALGGVWPVKVRNVGATPAFIRGLLTVRRSDGVDAVDPSTLQWEDFSPCVECLSPGSEFGLVLPLSAEVGPGRGLLLGVHFRDIHGEEWLSWRQLRYDKDAWQVTCGRAGEFPLV